MGPGSPVAAFMERWNELPRNRQYALIAIGVAAIIGVYFVFLSSSSPRMVVAFSGLAPEDSAAIADELESRGIQYDIGAGGANVSVPANQVAEVRLALAQAGLTEGAGVGFEIFDKTNFGATDFHNQVNYLRALTGELTRSINTLEPVKASRINIVLPAERLFTEDQAEATASVLLELRPGIQLNEQQVVGIVNLVSHSVEGLDRAGITVIQSTGEVLYDGATAASPFAVGASATQMDMQRKYEAALQRDLNTILAQVVGQGRSAVTVRAAMNFDSVTEMSDQFADAEDSTPRSSTTTTETFNGNGLTVGGIPGTGANDGDGADTEATGESQYTRTETTTNNEISRTTTETVRAPGRVERLSVSVVLDESITPAQEASITSAVAAAVGLDQARGDQLSVTRLPFDESVREQFAVAEPGGFDMGFAMDVFKGFMLILAIVLAFVLLMLLMRSLSKRQLMLAAPQQPSYLVQGATPLALEAPQPTPQQLAQLNVSSDPHETRVFTLAESNPRAVADVVQTWMREDG